MRGALSTGVPRNDEPADERLRAARLYVITPDATRDA